MFKTKVDPSMIHGSVLPGFESVREEFVNNFIMRGELGSACSIYHKGKKVVDLWGGYRDIKSHAPWEENTMVLVFSSTKGMASMAMAVANSRGLFDYDEKVATYWPEFSQNGKSDITVRQLLSHQAGLCVIDKPLTLETLADLDSLAKALAEQKPFWEPGTKQGYHGLTLGWYSSELIRRVDPKHRSLGKYFQDEVATPLGIEFYIGLPLGIHDLRIAPMRFPNPIGAIISLLFNKDPKSQPFFKAMRNSKSLTARSLNNPKGYNPNDRTFLVLENPSFTGVGEARAIARTYSVFASGGRELNINQKTLKEMTNPASPPSLGFNDQILGIEAAFSIGFLKPSSNYRFGSNDSAFGAPGAGGSFGFADPDAQVGYAYVTNKMGMKLIDDPREVAIRNAFYKCLRNKSNADD